MFWVFGGLVIVGLAICLAAPREIRTAKGLAVCLALIVAAPIIVAVVIQLRPGPGTPDLTKPEDWGKLRDRLKSVEPPELEKRHRAYDREQAQKD